MWYEHGSTESPQPTEATKAPASFCGSLERLDHISCKAANVLVGVETDCIRASFLWHAGTQVASMPFIPLWELFEYRIWKMVLFISGSIR
jgi:hypothetical protein